MRSQHRKLTVKVRFDLQVADSESQHTELVQPADGGRIVGQQASHRLQFSVEALAMPLRRIRRRRRLWRFPYSANRKR